MRRSVIVFAGFAVIWSAAESSLSGQTSAASSSLTVTASVSKNCTITTAPVAFGAYDPVGANATANLDAPGKVTVACTKGAVATVGLGLGNNALGNTRRMAQGAAAFMNYELYQDAGHSTIWGNTINDSLPITAAPNRNPRDYTVYGRVAAAQDVTVGSYTDSVVATVNF